MRIKIKTPETKYKNFCENPPLRKAGNLELKLQPKKSPKIIVNKKRKTILPAYSNSTALIAFSFSIPAFSK